MTNITKKTLTLASLLLMTSGGVWGYPPSYISVQKIIQNNRKSSTDPAIDSQYDKLNFTYPRAPERFVSFDAQSQTHQKRRVGKTESQRPSKPPPPPPSGTHQNSPIYEETKNPDAQFQTDQNSHIYEEIKNPDAQSQTHQKRRVGKTESQRPSKPPPPPPSPELIAKRKEAQEKAAAKKKEAALQEGARKKADADIKAAAKKEALLKKTSEQKVKKELDHFIQGPGFFEKIKQKIWAKKDSQTQILVSDIYKDFTDYLMKNQTITQKGMTALLFPKIENLNAYDKEAWKKIIETDARAITSKWVYEGNKNFTPRNAAVFAVKQAINNPNAKNYEDFQNVLFKGQGHKKFRKNLIIELKKQAPKKDIVWKDLLDIAPTFKPKNSTGKENLKTFTEIMCSGGAKIFKGFAIQEGQHKSKKQQWAEALLQSETYKPTMIQRIFRRLTPLENILIQSTFALAKNGSIGNLNDRILWLSRLAGDKKDNILGQVYQKIHAHNKGKILSEISLDARAALDDVPDVKKGMKSKS